MQSVVDDTGLTIKNGKPHYDDEDEDLLDDSFATADDPEVDEFDHLVANENIPVAEPAKPVEPAVKADSTNTGSGASSDDESGAAGPKDPTGMPSGDVITE